MSGITSGIENLIMQGTEPYSVSAPINSDGTLDTASSMAKGNADSNLFVSEEGLGKMDFLKLLMTQLQFQDPFEPMGNSEFLSQLAQFSALEGTANIEQAISGMNDSYQDSLNIQSFSALSITNASAVSLIGKHIRIGESTVKYSGIPGEDEDICVHLGNNDTATVKILDDNGETIKTFTAGGKDAENSVNLTWDGKNDEGEYVQAGTYYLYVEGQETDAALYCYIEDVVLGVRYTTDGPMIKIGGKELPLGNILDISMAVSDTSINSGQMNTNTLSLLGKTVKYQKSELTLTPSDGDYMNFNVNLAGFESAIVEIKDADGNVVYSMKVEAENGNTAQGTLMCTDFNQNGPYTVSLAGNTSAFFYDEGVVEGISTIDGITKIKVNGLTVSVSEIFEISNTTLNS